MNTDQLDLLRDQLAKESKYGLNFILPASIIWLLISYLWTLDFSSYNKSIFVFVVGGLMLPLAFLFSKLLKTTWKVENNPLQPLGLWLNFAQLVYFPFLILTMIKMPDYFIMVYAIITGAHFLPYAWFYKTKWYAIFSVIISVGVLLIGLNVDKANMYLTGVFTSFSLLALALGLYYEYSVHRKLSAS